MIKAEPIIPPKTKPLASRQDPSPATAPQPIAKRKTGRPIAKDRHKSLAATKPWEAEGMSRATWFNRQREARLKQ